jgi:hypothetical protein
MLLCGSGCITASLATLGTVVGFLGSAASTGADVYKLGKLDAALMATPVEIHQAVRDSACDLGLELVSDPSGDPNVWQAKLLDDQKRDITVRVESRASHLCICRVDVGFFGSEPVAKVIMERIRAHLPHQLSASRNEPMPLTK